VAGSGEQSNGIVWIRWLSFVGIFVAGTAMDLLTKQWIFSWRGLPGQQPVWWIWEPFIGIETAVNPGALFGMGAGFGPGFAALSVFAAVAIVIWLYRFRAIDSWWLLIALACVMAGIFGNLYDRLGLWNPPADVPEWSSGVRDWILFRYESFVWPNFNIADSLLVCGAIMLAIHSFFMSPATETGEESPKTAT
jgi:signal peptidase II